MKYDCRISGEDMICTLTAARQIRGAVFCFSGMAPLAPVSGGTLQRSVGSFTEVALPDLEASTPHTVVLRYKDGFTPANRAWMPLGPYLRLGEEIIPLPPTPSGRVAPPPQGASPMGGLPLIPQPTKWTPAGGTLVIDGVITDGHDVLARVGALAQRQNMRFDGTQSVTFVDAAMAEDAYRLAISSDGIVITAGSDGGRFYAGITLLSLLQHGPLPCGEIIDSPRFGWRGQHLDTARHFYEPDSILALLDLMALLKLNRFHWHFADDEAFRIELDTLPELSRKTKFRGEGEVLPALFAGSPLEGGSYSKATAREIIARAKDLNIEVMPEIETPAHALALTEIFPMTRDPDDTGKEASVQGYKRNVLNPAMPQTWDVWEALVREIAELFPFDHLHLGCDELPKDTWMGSPLARTLMAEHGLETTQDLQGWTIARLAAFTKAQGKRPAAWEEAAQGSNGGIGHDALLFSWTGTGPGLDAARAGYDVVMTPAQHVYLDMAHTADLEDWGASWAAFVDLPDTINWSPVPNPDLRDRIVGVQGAFWSEFTTADHQLWPMLMPRMLGVAMMAWQEDTPQLTDLTAGTAIYRVSESGAVAITPIF